MTSLDITSDKIDHKLINIPEESINEIPPKSSQTVSITEPKQHGYDFDASRHEGKKDYHNFYQLYS